MFCDVALCDLLATELTCLSCFTQWCSGLTVTQCITHDNDLMVVRFDSLGTLVIISTEIVRITYGGENM